MFLKSLSYLSPRIPHSFVFVAAEILNICLNVVSHFLRHTFYGNKKKLSTAAARFSLVCFPQTVSAFLLSYIILFMSNPRIYVVLQRFHGLLHTQPAAIDGQIVVPGVTPFYLTMAVVV